MIDDWIYAGADRNNDNDNDKIICHTVAYDDDVVDHDEGDGAR